LSSVIDYCRGDNLVVVVTNCYRLRIGDKLGIIVQTVTRYCLNYLYSKMEAEF
jgi:hypothetical protein